MKRAFLKKIIAIAVVSMSLLTMAPAPVSASWVRDRGNNWRYMYGYSSAVGWTQINGSWYYFSSDGVMQTGVIQVDGKIYLLSDSGEMQTGNAVIGGTVYTFSSNGSAIGDELPTPSKGFDWAGNSAQVFSPDQVVSGGGSPTDPDSSAFEEEEKSKTEYSLTYKDDDGDRLKTKNAKRNDKVKLYKPTKSGYKFVEWNTRKNGNGTSYDYDEEIKMTKDLTLYAQWEKSSGSTDSGSTDSGSSKNNVSVTDITVSSQGDTDKITTPSGTLQMKVNILPIDASNKNVTWSVENKTGQATINESGLLTAASNGTVVVKATAKDGSNVVAIDTITISGQTSGGSSGGDSGSGGGTTGGDTSGGTTAPTLEDYTVQSMDTTRVNGTVANPKAYKTLSVLRSTETNKDTGVEKPFTLENVNAETLAIQGGDKIVLNNCKIKNLKINDADGTFDLEVGDNCTIDNMELSKGTKINSKSKLGTININTEEVVTIGSSVSTVNVNSIAKVKIGDNAVIDKMKVGNESKNSIISGNATITQFESGSTVQLAVTTITDNRSIIQNIPGKVSEFQGEIDNALLVETATLAVERAEKSKEDINNAARNLVTSLPDSVKDKRDQLIARLDQIKTNQDQLAALEIARKDVESAEEKVRLATTTSAQVTLDAAKEEIRKARASVGNLIHGTADEINLTERLDVADDKIKKAENLKTILDAIKNNAIKDSTTINEGTFNAAGILGVTSTNVSEIKTRLNGVTGIKTAENLQQAVSEALKAIDLEEKIKAAVDSANAAINDAKSQVDSLYLTDGITLKSGVGKTAINMAQDKLNQAKQKIDSVNAFGTQAANFVTQLQNSYKPVNEKFINAVGLVTKAQVDGLFGQNNTLATGIGKNEIDAAEVSVNTLLILAQGAGMDTTNIALLGDKIDAARQLLIRKDQITEALWNSVTLEGGAVALGDSNLKLASKSSVKGDYTFKVSLPTVNSYVDNSNVLSLNGNSIFSYSGNNNSTAEISMNVVGTPGNIKVPVMFKNDGATGVLAWSYNTSCKTSQADSNQWAATVTTPEGYTFKFTITYTLQASNNVFTITMTPQ